MNGFSEFEIVNLLVWTLICFGAKRKALIQSRLVAPVAQHCLEFIHDEPNLSAVVNYDCHFWTRLCRLVSAVFTVSISHHYYFNTVFSPASATVCTGWIPTALRDKPSCGDWRDLRGGSMATTAPRPAPRGRPQLPVRLFRGSNKGIVKRSWIKKTLLMVIEEQLF